MINKYYADFQTAGIDGNIFVGQESYYDDFRTYYEFFEKTDKGVIRVKSRVQYIPDNEIAYSLRVFSLKDLDPSILKSQMTLLMLTVVLVNVFPQKIGVIILMIIIGKTPPSNSILATIALLVKSLHKHLTLTLTLNDSVDLWYMP